MRDFEISSNIAELHKKHGIDRMRDNDEIT
jgi:hypothetical protein